MIVVGKTRPRDIGTQAESAVLKVLSQHWPTADRAPLRGNLDQGDILGTPYVWEVKGGHAAESASDGQIDKWLAETTVEFVNARKAALARRVPPPIHGFLVTKRKAIGPKNAHDWWVHFDASTAAVMLGLPTGVGYRLPMRMRLGDLCVLLTRERLDGTAG